MKIREYLQNLIARKNNELAELKKRSDESTDIDEVKEIGSQIDAIKDEIKEAEEQLNEISAIENDLANEQNKESKPGEETAPINGENDTASEPTSEEVQRSAAWKKVEPSNLKQVFSQETRGGVKMEKNLEQRKAFMNAVYTGDYSKVEKRAVTDTGNVEIVIPENLVNDIITEVRDRGYIISKCNKTNFGVGQTIPVGLLQIKATWVGKKEGTQLEKSGEGLGSSVQNGGVESTIVFFNYKLRCEVALTYETKIQSLPIFEEKFVQQVSDAMVDELEAAVVAGDGINQPKGVLLETPRSGKALEIASGTKMTYPDIVKFVGAVPRKYRRDAVAFMTQNTFNDFMSIVDDNGQPVAKVNTGVDGDLVYRLLGMPVELADEYLEDYALNVEEDTKFAFIYNFKEYTINTNYDLGIQTKEDWDTENKHIKAVMAADGKAVTKYSLVTFTKKAPTAGV